jgi:biotin-(acetyl-CoA carboxylase) ligase
MPSFLSETADFPPLVTPFRLRERLDAFEAAQERAAEDGAGSLYFVGRFELLEFAIVLEPAEPLRLARKIFFAGMNAIADSLAVLSPPEKPIAFRYPGSLYFDGALIGGGRLAWPAGASEDQPPEWLVFGGMVRAGGMRDLGAGLAPEITTLDDEGFESWSPELFAASFARNFLVEVDSWGEKGFSGIGPRYLGRLDKVKGQGKRGIDVNGDLLIHAADGSAGATREAFLASLKAADWYDPLLNEPRS